MNLNAFLLNLKHHKEYSVNECLAIVINIVSSLYGVSFKSHCRLFFISKTRLSGIDL